MQIFVPDLLALGFSMARPAHAAEPRPMRIGLRQVALVELFIPPVRSADVA